ncbi:PIG-P-domain-containing protein [Peziza echinospora]|nr:PIG-P-domain-containing protein [Peziza echinospora]
MPSSTSHQLPETPTSASRPRSSSENIHPHRTSSSDEETSGPRHRRRNDSGEEDMTLHPEIPSVDYSSTSSYNSDSSNPTSPIQPSNLFPPFYNRPPTPLPPSPSLTSLLLPRRATTPNLVASPPSDSSHIAFHTPRASPKVPTYEYYGFVLYLGSSACFLVYILWSYLPSSILHALGIHYYPNRWWSLALPSWLVMLLVYIYVALAAYNTGYMTVKLGAVEGVVDNAAQIAAIPIISGKKEKDWRKMWDKGTDGVIDVPMGGVCEVLYGDDRDLEDWELDE